MNNSINASPSANAGVQQSKTSSLESANGVDSSDESSGFTAAMASVESETDSAEQQLGENSSESIEDIVVQGQYIDGNSLPAEEQMAMWQAIMLIQPAESEVTQSFSPQLQSMDLLNAQRKPVLNSSQLNGDYFNTMIMQNKDGAANLPAGFASNNINMQLAAAQLNLNPQTNESILFNMSEQISPMQGVNSTLTQSLAAVGLGTATQAAVTQTQMAPLSLGQNAWESNLGSRLQMMVGQNIQTAEIRLDPPELGELGIKIKVSNDVASVNITAANAQVREALETAVPKLREMFAESGVSLGDVNVRQESFAQQQNSEGEEERGGFAQGNESDFGDESATVTRKIVSDSLLDIYA